MAGRAIMAMKGAISFIACGVCKTYVALEVDGGCQTTARELPRKRRTA
jgi:hypothetical protein